MLSALTSTVNTGYNRNMKVEDLSELDKLSPYLKNFILGKLNDKKKKKKKKKKSVRKNLNPINQLSHTKVVELLLYFKTNRKEQYKCAQHILDRIVYAERHKRKAHIVVIAEEKSGKREISQILALLVKYFINTKKVSDRSQIFRRIKCIENIKENYKNSIIWITKFKLSYIIFRRIWCA